jgi:hypothetical protein
MKAQVFIEANGRPELGKSIVRFGKRAREDKDCEVHIYQIMSEQEPKQVIREFVLGQKIKKYDLPAGNRYVVLVIGDKIAGVASTSPAELESPFNVYMNPPEDHSKDFMRLDVPTNVPIEGDLKRSILSALKEK